MPNILATQRSRKRHIDISLLPAYNQEPVCFVSEEVEDKKICIIPLDSSWCYLILPSYSCCWISKEYLLNNSNAHNS